MRLTANEIDQAIKDGIDALVKNRTKNRANVYPAGFVPNSYNWPAPAERVVVRRTADGGYKSTTEIYDRKRSRGTGSYITLWNK